MGFAGAGWEDTDADADPVKETTSAAHLWGCAVSVAAGLDVVADEAVPVPPSAGAVVDGEQAGSVRRRAVGGPDRLRRSSSRGELPAGVEGKTLAG